MIVHHLRTLDSDEDVEVTLRPKISEVRKDFDFVINFTENID